jgi:hypothetical protein
MRVMIIGASNDRAKFGNKAVRAYRRQKHDVFPVNPHEEKIEGLTSYHSVADVPGPIDRALFYVPPETGIDIVDDLVTRGDVSEVWLNPGAESTRLIEKAQRLGVEPIQACSIIDIGEIP